MQAPASAARIGYHNQLLAMGSCFTEHIGGMLQYYKFNVDLHPFGIVYNPVSLHQQLRYLMGNQLLVEGDLFQHHGLWHSFMHHGHFSGTHKAQVRDGINARIQQARKQMQQTDLLILSLGTTWIYELAETGMVVANCHKVPEKEFRRRLVTVDYILDTLGGTLHKLQAQYPQLRIVFTISPVRHLKDGATGNQVSKATLQLAVDQMVKEGRGREYFPAYEIMMDDLRDYRFYAEDMVHPSALAINYIWEQFLKAHIDKKAHQLMNQVADIQAAMQHRPLNPTSEAHQLFLKKHLVKVMQLKAAYPMLDMQDAVTYFSGK